jgi:hypothetical protein
MSVANDLKLLSWVGTSKMWSQKHGYAGDLSMASVIWMHGYACMHACMYVYTFDCVCIVLETTKCGAWKPSIPQTDPVATTKFANDNRTHIGMDN